MRVIIFSSALFIVSAAICNSPQISEYEVFAQKYEATFGEKPSDQVWNLGKESCSSGCSGGGGCGLQ
jgi:hypothetical protein